MMSDVSMCVHLIILDMQRHLPLPLSNIIFTLKYDRKTTNVSARSPHGLITPPSSQCCTTTEQKWQNCASLSGIFRCTYVFIWCSYAPPCWAWLKQSRSNEYICFRIMTIGSSFFYP
jgi:hypothetical protein